MEKIHNCYHGFILPTVCLLLCSAKLGLISCLQGWWHGAEQDIAEHQGWFSDFSCPRNPVTKFVHEFWHEQEEKGIQMRDLSISSSIVFVHYSVQATTDVQRHIAILRTVMNQIDFLLPSTIHALRVQKKTTYLADTSEAIPISLCENKDPPQL